MKTNTELMADLKREADACPLTGSKIPTLMMEAMARIRELDTVATVAQGVLTAMNIGGVQSESPLHHALRSTMIAYRESINA